MTDEHIIAMIQRGLHETTSRRNFVLPPLRIDMSLAELGIDSIEFIEAFSYVEEELGRMLPSDQLTSARTIGELVALVQRELFPEHAATPGPCAEVSRTLPPRPLRH